jgi:hypothetical protein
MNTCTIFYLVTTKMVLFAQGNIVLFNFMSKYLLIQYSVDF